MILPFCFVTSPYVGQVISQVRQAYPMVRVNITNLIFDDIIQGDINTRYGVDSTAAGSDELINQSVTSPQPPTVQQTNNLEDRLVVYHYSHKRTLCVSYCV